jgi:hypothetical protein
MFARPKTLKSKMVAKKLKNFKSMIGLQKQTLPHSSKIFHSYAIELNYKLFFCLCNLFYKFVIFKEKRMKKNVEF